MKLVIIVITGTPGTGKSTWAKFLSLKLKLFRLDLHKYYPRLALSYNKKKQCYDLEERKLKSFVQKKSREHPEGLIIDSHVAHLLPKKLVDLCLVLICSDLKELKRRLERRKYSSSKVRENLDAEIFQVCLTEAKEKGHKVIMFDTAQKLRLLEVLDAIKSVLKAKNI